MTDYWLDEVYKKSNSELYDGWENYHDEVINERGWKCHTLASNWIIDNFPEGTEVGDIGCGNGQVGLGLINHKYLIDGYDLNQPMLNRFVAGNYRTTKKLDITKEPLPQKYKCLTAIGVLTFGHVDASASKHIADSLTDDGLLYCSMCITPKDWIIEGGWTKQTDLEVVSTEKVHSLTTPEGEKKYHNMVIWKKSSK
jgi:SAM-dependent methyltransferase